MKTKSILFCAAAIGAWVWGAPLLKGGQPPSSGGDRAQPATPAEASSYLKYTQSQDIAAFLSVLDSVSPELAVTIVGQSLPAEESGARPIFLAILSERPAASPDALDRSRPTVLFTAAQHGNEQSAKEAALWLLRDLAAADLRPLLKSVNVLVMPQTNPYGNFLNLRRDELGLDMNRDHIKLESAGARAIHRVFSAWMPEVSIDIHEKGDDYYRVSIGCVSNLNIAANLQDFSRRTILAEVEQSLKKKRVTFHEYLVTEELGIDTSSGAAYRAGPEGPREEMKRFSTTDLNDGRNSLGIFETLSFIQEGASRHDLETLRDRTRWQYDGLRSFLESVARHGPEILALVRSDRSRLLERAKAQAENDSVHLRMKFARDAGQPQLFLKTFERAPSPIRGILRVDKKAGETLTEEDIAPYPLPRNLRVVDEVVKNWFPNVESTLAVRRPSGYFLSGDRLDIVETLLGLGVQVGMLEKDGLFEAEVYAVTGISPAKLDYLAPEKVEIEVKSVQVPLRKGDFYVSCVQPAANLIPCLLEPQSEFGLIRYWKYKLVPEPGGVFAAFRQAGKAAPAVIPYQPW
jgi:hypothetical protein